jgi:hypothetical protein
MFKLVILLICLALRAAIYVVIASGVLSMVRTFLRPRWIDHPAVRTIIALGEALCQPARSLLELLGISTRPFDFSPLVTVVVLEIALALFSVFR